MTVSVPFLSIRALTAARPPLFPAPPHTFVTFIKRLSFISFEGVAAFPSLTRTQRSTINFVNFTCRNGLFGKSRFRISIVNFNA